MAQCRKAASIDFRGKKANANRRKDRRKSRRKTRSRKKSRSRATLRSRDPSGAGRGIRESSIRDRKIGVTPTSLSERGKKEAESLMEVLTPAPFPVRLKELYFRGEEDGRGIQFWGKKKESQ